MEEALGLVPSGAQSRCAGTSCSPSSQAAEAEDRKQGDSQQLGKFKVSLGRSGSSQAFFSLMACVHVRAHVCVQIHVCAEINIGTLSQSLCTLSF